MVPGAVPECDSQAEARGQKSRPVRRFCVLRCHEGIAESAVPRTPFPSILREFARPPLGSPVALITGVTPSPMSSRDAGFTIVEVLVAALIMMCVVLAGAWAMGTAALALIARPRGHHRNDRGRGTDGTAAGIGVGERRRDGACDGLRSRVPTSAAPPALPAVRVSPPRSRPRSRPISRDMSIISIADGQWVGNGAAAPPAAWFTRRWAVYGRAGARGPPPPSGRRHARRVGRRPGPQPMPCGSWPPRDARPSDVRARISQPAEASGFALVEFSSGWCSRCCSADWRSGCFGTQTSAARLHPAAADLTGRARAAIDLVASDLAMAGAGDRARRGGRRARLLPAGSPAPTNRDDWRRRANPGARRPAHSGLRSVWALAGTLRSALVGPNRRSDVDPVPPCPAASVICGWPDGTTLRGFRPARVSRLLSARRAAGRTPTLRPRQSNPGLAYPAGAVIAPVETHTYYFDCSTAPTPPLRRPSLRCARRRRRRVRDVYLSRGSAGPALPEAAARRDQLSLRRRGGAVAIDWRLGGRVLATSRTCLSPPSRTGRGVALGTTGSTLICCACAACG